MKELVPDGSIWQGLNDLYDGFFRAVSAPEWQGRNFNALIDSIEAGNINAVEVPFRLIPKNDGSSGPGDEENGCRFC